MIYFTQEAQEKLDKLFYYPYTFGKHLDKANRDLHSIEMSIPHLPLRIGTHSITIRGIGSFTYLCNGKDIFIQFITWSTLLTNFYYKKSNFIVFTSSSNILSTHPSLYIDRKENYFHCDNGFSVVSRYVNIRGKKTEVFNFKDLDGNIICDIDFTQVKPFDEYKDMTARGYTPDRRCYMVFEDGYKEEVNESRSNKLERLINECVDIYLSKCLNENKTTNSYTLEEDIIGLRVVGYRYGIAPENGFSYNTNTHQYEPGVSMAQICFGKEIQSFAVDAQSKKRYYYIGDVSGIGGDDEICLTNCKRITYNEYLSLRNQMVHENNMIVNYYADLKLRLHYKGYYGYDEDSIENFRKKYSR